MRKNKTGKTYTLRQGLRLNLRAIRLWNTILPHYWLWSVSLCLAENFSPYFGLYMSAQIITELAGACDRARLLGLAAVTVGGNFALALAKKWLANRRDVLEHASWRAHEAYMMGQQNTFPYSLLEDPQTALLRTRIYEDMEATGQGMPHVKDAINNLLSAGINILLSASLTVSLFVAGCDGAASGGMGGLLGFLHTPLSSALVLGVIVGSAVVSLRLVGIRTQKVSDAINGLAEDNIRWRAFNRLQGPDMYLFGLYRFVEEDFRRTQLRPPWLFQAEKYIIRYDGLSLLAAAASGLAVFLLTAAKALSGAIGIGNFVLYQGAVSRFTGALGQLSIWVGRLWYNLPYLERLYSYLDQPNQMYQGSLAVEKRDDLDYEIEFRDVSFRYPRTENWVLRHVNIRFKIGTKLAIVGENGSGKTTFIKLLCRLYDPTEGRILLNGIDITRYRYGEYMDLFSVVFQDFSLFDFPLGELVAADPDYDPARVRDCLVRAGFGEKLAALDADPPAARPTLDLPLGKNYDNEGIELSGGERQKVALARALYKDAPFFVLDEPTAALDPIAEAAVYENFNRLVRDKTAVFISHRLSSCRFCDAIAVFDHGQLVQLGAHDALLADPAGKYSQLWQAQAQYYS